MLLNWPLLIVVVDDALESSSFLSPAKVLSGDSHSIYILELEECFLFW